MDYFLTIAASDNSGGAGIQQDIKVAHDLDYWALSAITGITAQNFKNVFTIEAVNPSLLKYQIEQCFLSFPVKTVKIGAICSKENINVIAGCLKKFSPKHVVLDPVLSSTSGASFIDASSFSVLKEVLFPLAELITPNKPEFELLSNEKISSFDEAVKIASDKSREWNTSILLKGGHFTGSIIKEALITRSDIHLFERKRNMFLYEHGTGCTISSAIACFLGKNKSLYDSYSLSSEYLIKLYTELNNQ